MSKTTRKGLLHIVEENANQSLEPLFSEYEEMKGLIQAVSTHTPNTSSRRNYTAATSSSSSQKRDKYVRKACEEEEITALHKKYVVSPYQASPRATSLARSTSRNVRNFAVF